MFNILNWLLHQVKPMPNQVVLKGRAAKLCHALDSPFILQKNIFSNLFHTKGWGEVREGLVTTFFFFFLPKFSDYRLNCQDSYILRHGMTRAEKNGEEPFLFVYSSPFFFSPICTISYAPCKKEQLKSTRYLICAHLPWSRHFPNSSAICYHIEGSAGCWQVDGDGFSFSFSSWDLNTGIDSVVQEA